MQKGIQLKGQTPNGFFLEAKVDRFDIQESRESGNIYYQLEMYFHSKVFLFNKTWIPVRYNGFSISKWKVYSNWSYKSYPKLTVVDVKERWHLRIECLAFCPYSLRSVSVLRLNRLNRRKKNINVLCRIFFFFSPFFIVIFAVIHT